MKNIKIRNKPMLGRAFCSHCKKDKIYDTSHNKRSCYLAKIDSFIDRNSRD